MMLPIFLSKEISYPFVIHKFKKMENSHVLLVTGQNENILTLVDKEGEIIAEYLKKEIPYIMFRPYNLRLMDPVIFSS